MLPFADDTKQTIYKYIAWVFGFGALRLDEATPYLHIDFIPYTTGSKRGLETRVSLKKDWQNLDLRAAQGAKRNATSG